MAASKTSDNALSTGESDWYRVAERSAVSPGSPLRVRIAGRQIALFDNGESVYACNNLCPHEGFPLSEGSLSGRCVLTCNWHNWKFDLESGANLYGGDRLTTYPVAIRDGGIWVDLTDPPLVERRKRCIDNLEDAFRDAAYDRIAREIARLIRLDNDPLVSARLAIHWSWQHMEFGWTHAFAGMADWLTLFNEFDGDTERQLVCLVESVAHAADDVVRETIYPYREGSLPYEEEAFVEAVEAEDEDLAIALVRGGIDAGLVFAAFERGLTRAALAHYQDFGHSLIYVTKMRQLDELLGQTVLEPLLLSLVRSLIFATREDRIPEFRHYGRALSAWNETGGNVIPLAENWRGKGIRSSLNLTLESAGRPPHELYHELLLANAWNLLHFDLAVEDQVNVSVSGNVGWLDFTHGITFANAVRDQCTRFPELWPRGLLQMACFQGRNAAFTADRDASSWEVEDTDAALRRAVDQVIDHAQGEYIVSVHLLKTALAVRQEAAVLESGASLLVASLNRFLGSPLRRRRPRRTAWQSLRFVAREYGEVAED